MMWNDEVKPITEPNSPKSKVVPKKNLFNNNSNRKKNLITSKSSMIGVLGVVPEENDSENEDNPLKFTSLSQLKESPIK